MIELEAGMTLTVTGPCLIAVSPPVPRGKAPGYDPAKDVQLEIMRAHMKALGYDLTVSPSETAPQGTDYREPRPKTRQEGPVQGESFR